MNHHFNHDLTTLTNVEISKLLIKEEDYLKKRLNSYLGNERPPDEWNINNRIEAYKYRLEKDKLFVIISSNELTSNILKLINERENLINVPLGQKVDEIIYSSTLIIELNQYNYLKEVINNDINQLEFYLNMLKDNQRVIEYEPFVNAVKNIFDIFRTSKETLVLHTWYQKYYLNLHRLTNKELKDVI